MPSSSHRAPLPSRRRFFLPSWFNQTWETVLLALGLVLLAIEGTIYISRSNPVTALVRVPEIAGGVLSRNASDATAPLSNTAFENEVSRLAAAGTPASLETLLLTLRQSEPFSQRDMALAALRDVPETLEPNLRDSLDDVDPGIRAGVAHALGARLDYQAVNGLIGATQDPYASVRREAVQSLGELDAWQALPRLHQIEMLDPDSTVKQAARSAENALKADVAGALGVESSQRVFYKSSLRGQ